MKEHIIIDLTDSEAEARPQLPASDSSSPPPSPSLPSVNTLLGKRKRNKASLPSAISVAAVENEEQGANRFRYWPLAKGSIRLFVLHPAALSGDKLVAHFVTSDVLTPCAYEALSWHWGISEFFDDCNVEIVDRSNVQLPDPLISFLRITKNLDIALRALRLSKEERILWIDQVCLDQLNEHEKHDQIPLMAQIYGQASRVCIWLGREAPDSSLVPGFVHRITTNNGWSHVFEKNNMLKLLALEALMRRPWFSRRWVVQEVCFAKTAEVYFGKSKLDWARLSKVISLYHDDSNRIAQPASSSAVSVPQLEADVPLLWYGPHQCL